MPTPPRNTATPQGLLEVAVHGPQGSEEAGNAILRQEAAGQQSFVNSSTLPRQMSSDARKVLEQAGVVFGDPVPGDDLFVYVTLPEGWTKSGTSHSMHSDLLDDKGRKRAGIFYKAAFYDRRANLTVNRRFDIGMDYDRSKQGVIVKFITDGGSTRVFTTEERAYEGEQYDDDYTTKDVLAGTEVKTWLAEHFPDWEDASAYWD